MSSKYKTSLTSGMDGLDPEYRMRIEAMARVFRGTTRALSGAQVAGLTVHADGMAPGWTDGELINLSSAHLPRLDLYAYGITTNTLAVWLGVTYHELNHVLFTPRQGSTLVKRIKAAIDAKISPNLWNTFNVVEDQRGERLVIAKFEPLRAYLTAAVVKLIVSEGVDNAWPLLAGRVWIPGDARAKAFDAWAKRMGVVEATRIGTLIGEYQALADPAELDAGRAYLILLELADLLRDGAPSIKGCGNPNPDRGTDQPTEADTPTAADDPAPQPEQGEGEGDGETEGDEGEDGEAGGQGEGDESDEGDEPGQGEGDGTEGDDAEGDSAEGEGEGEGDEGDSDEGNSPGAGDTPGKPETTMEEDLKEAARDLLKDDAVRKDLDSIRDAVEEAQGEDLNRPRQAVTQVTPTDGDRIACRAVAGELRRIVADTLPAWERRTDHGKLNVGRWATARDFDPETMFDRFDPGMQDETSLEVVVLLDVSGSMDMGDRRIVPAAAATWAIRQAVEQVQGDITVLTFESVYRILARKGERSGGMIAQPKCSGGTNPTSALMDAYRILSRSEAVNRMLVLVTDGDWNKGRDTARLLMDKGVMVVVVGIKENLPANLPGTVKRSIQEPIELAEIFKEAAAELMNKAIAGGGIR